MISIGFIRHGTTEWNLAGRMQGQMDTPLAEIGRLQADRLAGRLKGESWDGIIASDLQRAKETAQRIEAVTGIPLLKVDARLRERSFGLIEGTTLEERIARWGEQWRTADVGMEPDALLLQRWQSFLADTEQEHQGERLLIVSHGGYIAPVIESIRRQALDTHLMNTSFTVMQRTSAGWEFQLLNCTAHLAQTDTDKQGAQAL
ncbi:probable phosphoglycerate mutase [Paenibacillus sp. UNCCL117]|uniref:histidine phosphatase family protein n=1 Tax=unclassified Paenibacillus TaxID=185978 RepID=UPI0008805461|nr:MULTISPECIES: histidine phosphatase family protein [unclassified Paenibacillus]SDC41130.1 probable phosphoglycerate mutase [Paenibacillus sp. cl123]SFW13610.1 probable phosphoglycerate mutase [Paenibacillus sp. UNCCL117]